MSKKSKLPNTKRRTGVKGQTSRTSLIAQAQQTDLALHTLGWKAFQDLCSQVCAEALQTTVAIYREAQDGGQDAVFLISQDAKGKSAVSGTVQCKFSSDASRRLRKSDITGEIKVARELAAKGLAHTYYLMTSMGVDAPVAAEIRNELLQVGVVEPHILGREWITLKIRESARLRALVPRVYGLGDLSTILDQRRADQTRALLGHLLPGLRVYVPTAAHRRAVNILGEYGIVLLLGAPATGKSMLASILATTALDGDGHRCFQVDGPHDLIENWNPHESGAFYWIDDAFGPNQLREDYVDRWIAIMNKVKAAIDGGNRFVLTSRSHIWHAAKGKLATRNHPHLSSGTAVVEVGSLSSGERQQILYNHIKAGNQSFEWKHCVKEHLEALSSQTNLLPEIARRLADRSYTTSLLPTLENLKKFVSEPMEYLKETIGELNDAQKAALTLVFLCRSRLPTEICDQELWVRVSDRFSVGQAEIGEALSQLENTFLVQRSEAGGKFWSFIHPTISDALSSILGQRADLVELYVKGVKLETLLSEAICSGAPEVIRDAVVVPSDITGLLVQRLLETPDEPSLNRALFSFLGARTSEPVLREVVARLPGIFSRNTVRSWSLGLDPKTNFFARAHSLGLLPSSTRAEVARRLEEAIFNDLDGSFLDEEDILALIPPTRLFRLTARMHTDLANALEERICEIEEGADLEVEPEDNFEDVNLFLQSLQHAFEEHDDILSEISRADDQIRRAISKIEERKIDRSVDWVGHDISPKRVTAPKGSRSLFSDVDS